MPGPDASTDLTVAERIANVVSIDGLSSALIAGAGAAFFLNANMAEAVSFGAVVSLGRSVGHTAGIAMQKSVDLNARFTTLMDPRDFLFTALAVGLVQYGASGLQGPELYKSMGIAGVAGAVAPTLSLKFHDWAYGVTPPNTGGGGNP